MGRILLGITLTVLLLAFLATGFGAGWQVFFGPRARPVSGRSFEPTQKGVERGRYLVSNVLGCFFCHAPVDPADHRRPAPGRDGAGDVVIASGPGRVVAANLTPDPETGIGRWSDDEIARAVREGIGRDGRALFPMMPYRLFRALADDDLGAVIAYLRSIPPVHNDPGRTELAFPGRYLVRTVPEPLSQPVTADVSSPEKKGKYLVAIAQCFDCHTPFDDKQRPIAGLDFGGGNFINDREMRSGTTANITPDETGIKGYTAEVFRNVMRTGMSGGRKLSPLMPTYHYGGMTDEDLDAMFAWLRTVKPARHVVEQTGAAALCRVCNQTHTGGEKN